MLIYGERKVLDSVHKTEQLIIKLKRIAEKAIRKKKYNKALSALSACANVLYEYNQRYKDDDIEDMLLKIGKSTILVPDDFKPKETHPVKTVLFYDGFGMDLRGLAANITKNIATLGYKLIYVTKGSAKGKQPYICKELQDFNVEFIYINMSSNYVNWALELNSVFLKYSPQVAYFYTTPNDVSGAMVFNQYNNRVTRILVNLTDHAFWVGLNAFDFCGASRAMGAWINLKERGIPLEKMYRSRSNIFISEKIPLGAMPFDICKYRYVFSGGALYKTLGDTNNTFYKIIEHIIVTYSDVNYIYAGAGDDSEFKKLIAKYPDRVYLISEREDFYQIIKGAVFYLNTYPMFGGQMMRYAAYAGKLPITLKHNDDGQGILFHQEELGIEFDTFESVINEIDKILTDDMYRKSKEDKLHMAVVSKEETLNNYRMLIESQISPLPVSIEEFDTTQFRKQYIARLDFDQIQQKSIVKLGNLCLLPYFPRVFLRKVWQHVKRIE